jgi:hypothetical protein
VTGVYRSPTDLCVIFPRVFQNDTPEDKAAVQPLLSRVMVYPLTEFDGKMKSKDWKKTPSFKAPPSKGETQWVIPEKFFEQLPQVMKEIPPLPGEETLYKMIQSVLDAAAKDPRIKETLTQTAIAAEKDLIAPLFQFRNNGRSVGNGWTSPPNGARWGIDYLSRAATAKSNMYDNAPEETRYIYTDFDSGGPAAQRRARLHRDVQKGGGTAREGLLVADPLQHRALVRAESAPPLFARHQEQEVAEAWRRWVAHTLCPE